MKAGCASAQCTVQHTSRRGHTRSPTRVPCAGFPPRVSIDTHHSYPWASNPTQCSGSFPYTPPSQQFAPEHTTPFGFTSVPCNVTRGVVPSARILRAHPPPIPETVPGNLNSPMGHPYTASPRRRGFSWASTALFLILTTLQHNAAFGAECVGGVACTSLHTPLPRREYVLLDGDTLRAYDYTRAEAHGGAGGAQDEESFVDVWRKVSEVGQDSVPRSTGACVRARVRAWCACDVRHRVP